MERRYAASWDKDFFVSPFQDSGIGGGDNGVEGNGLALDERTCATSTTVYSWEFRLTHEHEGEATMRKVRGKDTKVKGPHFSRIKIVSRSWRRTSASPFVAGNTSLHDHVTGAAESTKHRCWNFGTEGDKSRLVFRVVLDLELSSQPCTLLRAIAAHPLMPHSMLAYIWLEAGAC